MWQNISQEAKDLIRKMLIFRQIERISAKEAFAHPWLQTQQTNTLAEEITQELMTNIVNFHV